MGPILRIRRCYPQIRGLHLFLNDPYPAGGNEYLKRIEANHEAAKATDPKILNHRMTDPRYKKLAKLLVEYSTELRKGDRCCWI